LVWPPDSSLQKLADGCGRTKGGFCVVQKAGRCAHEGGDAVSMLSATTRLPMPGHPWGRALSMADTARPSAILALALALALACLVGTSTCAALCQRSRC
jgi:hypothetical protein